MSLDDLSPLRMAPPESADDLGRRMAREKTAAARQHERDLEAVSLPPGRVGSVPYLNAVPLTRGLEHDIVFATPSRLAGLLRSGQLDAALVSVTEVLLHDLYEVLDGVAVASLGEVLSVFLAHRGPLEQATRIACDPASLTSVNLLKVLLAERGLKPELVPLDDYAAAARHDAVLLIGDRALGPAGGPAGTGSFQLVWDLGDEWCRWTGLPFVFAVWAARSGIDPSTVAPLLTRARDSGVANLAAIAAAEAAGHGLTVPQCLGYLRDNLHFHLGPREREALWLFRDKAAKLGLWGTAADGAAAAPKSPQRVS